MPTLARSRPLTPILDPLPSHLFLAIRQNFYLVQPLDCGDGADTVRAFRLNKADGTLYDVAQTRYGAQCDCPDFIYRRDGLDPAGCKHVKALVAQGLIDAGAAASSTAPAPAAIRARDSGHARR